MGALLGLGIGLIIFVGSFLLRAAIWATVESFFGFFRFKDWRKGSKKRILKGYQFDSFDGDRVIVLKKQRRKTDHPTTLRVQLAHVYPPHKKAAIYEESIALIRERLTGARCLEVELRYMDFCEDGAYYPAEIFVDDRSLNCECLRSGLFNGGKLANGKRIPGSLERSLQSAKNKKLGIHSGDPRNNSEAIEFALMNEKRSSASPEVKARAERIMKLVETQSKLKSDPAPGGS